MEEKQKQKEIKTKLSKAAIKEGKKQVNKRLKEYEKTNKVNKVENINVIDIVFLAIVFALTVFGFLLSMQNEEKKLNDTYPLIYVQDEMREPYNPVKSTFSYSKDWDYHDTYLLAKFAMYYAEDNSIEAKQSVISVVLNNLYNNNDKYPNIESTIKTLNLFLNQISYYDNTNKDDKEKRWEETEPDEDCYKAVENILNSKYDYSQGAIYFQHCIDNKTSDLENFIFLYEVDNIWFYK